VPLLQTWRTEAEDRASTSNLEDRSCRPCPLLQTWRTEAEDRSRSDGLPRSPRRTGPPKSPSDGPHEVPFRRPRSPLQTGPTKSPSDAHEVPFRRAPRSPLPTGPTKSPSDGPHEVPFRRARDFRRPKDLPRRTCGAETERRLERVRGERTSPEGEEWRVEAVPEEAVLGVLGGWNEGVHRQLHRGDDAVLPDARAQPPPP
jgi:hypothetical protein